MVAKVIRDYLAGGKNKLTVPGFGTFMRREGGGVVFVDLLRTDDGVLAQLVEDTGKYTEVEAMAIIDRYIFNARRDIERMGRTAWEQSVQAELQAPKPEAVKQEELFGGHEPRSTSSSRARAHGAAEPSYAELRDEGSLAHRRPAQRPVVRRPVPEPPRRPSKRADVIIVIAVIAAALAIIALAFGLSTGNMPFLR